MNRRELLVAAGRLAGAVAVVPLMKIVPVAAIPAAPLGKTWYVDAFAGYSTNGGDAPDNAFATLEDAIMATSREMGNAARESLEIMILGAAHE